MGDLAHDPGMCPDWESNRRPFGSQASAQSTEPHQPWHKEEILQNENMAERDGKWERVDKSHGGNWRRSVEPQKGRREGEVECRILKLKVLGQLP